jgi:hypothetical protein
LPKARKFPVPAFEAASGYMGFSGLIKEEKKWIPEYCGLEERIY